MISHVVVSTPLLSTSYLLPSSCALPPPGFNPSFTEENVDNWPDKGAQCSKYTWLWLLYRTSNYHVQHQSTPYVYPSLETIVVFPHPVRNMPWRERHSNLNDLIELVPRISIVTSVNIRLPSTYLSQVEPKYEDIHTPDISRYRTDNSFEDIHPISYTIHNIYHIKIRNMTTRTDTRRR